MTLNEALSSCGLVAILRGITPKEVSTVGAALLDAGIRAVEVPLNSPDPFESIGRLAADFAGQLVVGAGTVLDPEDVEQLKAAGSQICVSPDCNPAVISRAIARGLDPIPGVFTPSEAFTAVRHGAHYLKLFPAEAAGPTTVRAWRAVLPREVKVFAVGGITPDNMKQWIEAGCDGFGIGSNIYKPGMSADDVAKAAADFVVAFTTLRRRTA